MLINLFLLESFWKVYIVYLFKHIQQHRSLEVLYRIILFQSKTWNRNHKCHFHDAEAYSWEVLGTSSYHNLIMTDTLIVISLKHRLFHLISMKKKQLASATSHFILLICCMSSQAKTSTESHRQHLLLFREKIWIVQSWLALPCLVFPPYTTFLCQQCYETGLMK